MFRLALAVVLLLLPSPAHADITGKPRIIDGDTLQISNTKIRLHGIDAPEMRQTCTTSKGASSPGVGGRAEENRGGPIGL